MSGKTNRRAALIVATLGSFLTPFMVSAINIALPAIERDFGVDAVVLNWVATSYLLAAAVFLVPFGRIADIWGRKKVFIYGVVVYTASSAMAAVSGSISLLILSRAMQGLGSALMFATSAAILTSVFPAKERGKVFGINVAAVYTGLSIGPFLGGIMTQQLGWRSIFLINLPLGLLILVFVIWWLKGEWAEARGERLDIAGSLIYGAALVAIIMGFSELPKIAGGWLIAAGIAAALVLYVWENRADQPVLDFKLFQNNPVFAFSNLAALINYSATFAVGFVLSLYLQYIKGLPPQTAGLILVAQPAVMAVFSPFAGRLSDRIEPRVVASSGMAITAVGLFLFVFLGPETPTAFIVGSLVLLGFGFALFSSPNTNAVMSAVDKRFLGIASATLGTMRLIGQMFSMGIAMLVSALYVGRAQITPEAYPLFVNSVQVQFVIFAVLCFAGTFASMARGKMRRELVGVAEEEVR